MKFFSALLSMRMKTRMVTYVIISSLCSIFLVSASMLWIAREHAVEAVKLELESQLDLRQYSLSEYLASVEADLDYLSTSPSTAQAIKSFSVSYEKVGPEILRRAYIENNPNPVGEKHLLDAAEAEGAADVLYHAAHRRAHVGLRAFLEARGYYDIFLINPEGDLVYTVFKEMDYATNLQSGAYADSGLGRAWRAARQMQPGQVAFSDFESYAPSHGAAASFVAMPVYGQASPNDSPTVVGVVAVQLAASLLTAQIGATDVGNGSMSFLFGSDGVLRLDVPQTEEDDTLSTSFPVGLQAVGELVESVDLLGTPAFVGAVEVPVFGSKWYIAKSTSLDAAFAGFVGQRNLATIAVLPVILGAAIAAWFMARSFAQPMQSLTVSARGLAEGERVDIPTKTRGDEIGDLSRAMLELNDTARSAKRIETALEVTSMAVAVCDTGFEIVFANEAFEDALHRNSGGSARSQKSAVGASFDRLLKIAPEQRRTMEDMLTPHRTEIDFNGRVVDLNVFPIDDHGERIGYMVQWADITDERAAEDEIKTAISYASQGDFSGRITLDTEEPFFRNLEQSLNAIFEEVESFLGDLDATLTDFAAGDLGVSLDGTYDGQLGKISDRVAETARELESVIMKVKETSASISHSSLEISNDANDLAQRTESQAASIEQTAASMEEISSTVKENAENSSTADARAAEATELAERGREVVAETVAAMVAIRESASQISEVTSIIESLAFETHLLSLNASVEAARAGEAGKGFGVVAAEVGSLARRSTDEAKAIKKLIHTSEAQVAEGDRLVGETDTALSEIIASVRTAADMIKQIADASSGQSKSIDEIAIAVAEMDNMTQQNSQLAEKSSVSASVLTEQADMMMQSVATFVTRESDMSESRADAAWGTDDDYGRDDRFLSA